ncbi:ABC transporter ATP-binding protein [Singulisphaera sp. PoT]|uniref:ABC transporter ATP-binding protein n=1 Tax=Singulisphaera sp. PoT TaxID=3411797 RepID=UPI003BF513BE
MKALEGIDLDIQDGEFFVAVGPSGSGKSTLLRSIAGLESPSSGEIWIGGERVDRRTPRDRDVAMVFQTPALYPHLNVFDNLAFGLRARSTPKDETRVAVASVADRLGLSEVLRRMPRSLSGGQRQRVALGRAIARKTRVILLDEPFSSLDAPLRVSLRAELAELHRRLEITTVLVTHDQAEAMSLGDRIAVIDGGRIVQLGSPLEVYDHPASRFVATFVGQPPMNLLPCDATLNPKGLRIKLLGVDPAIAWDVPRGACPTPSKDEAVVQSVELGIRAEALSLAEIQEDETTPEASPKLNVELRRLDRLGHETLGEVKCGPHSLSVRLPAHARNRVGESLLLRLDLRQAVWFDRTSGVAIGS